MPSRAIFKINQREFDRAIRQERQFSKRDNPTICNTHSFYIVRDCARNTPKATRTKINKDLMMDGRLGVALLYLIVNSGRHPGYFGQQMAAAAKAERDSRKVATLAGGWVPAIKRFEPLADKVGGGSRGIPNIKNAKGYAKPATDGFRVKAMFGNENSAAWDTRDSAMLIAGPVLQDAFDREGAKMLKYIERKYKESARKAGIRVK